MTTRARLLALEAFGIKLGLDNMRVLVEALGQPQSAYPSVHVAGTNGKGSVCAMVERALRAAGYRTGLYTSPHLDRLEERVAIAGVPIEPGRFDAATGRVFAAVDAAQRDGRLTVTPTFFEATTTLAFDLFREACVDIAVVEVGLGGRFDATNVLSPRVAAITSIAFDHERHLGTTLAAIAGEKAGIAKAGVPLIVGRLPEEAAATIAATAAAIGAPLTGATGNAAFLGIEHGCVRLQPQVARWPGMGSVTLSLAGRHQFDNASTALGILAALDESGFAVSSEAVATGLSDARWPARLEWLRLDRGDLLIDAAHNPAGADALASYLEDLGGRRLAIVLAAMQDKDLEKMVRPMVPHAARFITTGVPTARAWPADALADRLSMLAPDTPVTAVPDPLAAIDEALGSHDRALAAGSIYFVGPLRARLLEAGAKPI